MLAPPFFGNFSKLNDASRLLVCSTSRHTDMAITPLHWSQGHIGYSQKIVNDWTLHAAVSLDVRLHLSMYNKGETQKCREFLFSFELSELVGVRLFYLRGSKYTFRSHRHQPIQDQKTTLTIHCCKESRLFRADCKVLLVPVKPVADDDDWFANC